MAARDAVLPRIGPQIQSHGAMPVATNAIEINRFGATKSKADCTISTGCNVP